MEKRSRTQAFYHQKTGPVKDPLVLESQGTRKFYTSPGEEDESITLEPPNMTEVSVNLNSIPRIPPAQLPNLTFCDLQP